MPKALKNPLGTNTIALASNERARELNSFSAALSAAIGPI